MFKWNPNPVMMFNTKVRFANLSTGTDTYSWSFEVGSPGTSPEENPSTMCPDGVAGSYTVTLLRIQISVVRIRWCGKWLFLRKCCSTLRTPLRPTITNDVNAGWDGKYAGEVLPSGMYNRTILTKNRLTGERYSYAGYLNLLK